MPSRWRPFALAALSLLGVALLCRARDPAEKQEEAPPALPPPPAAVPTPPCPAPVLQGPALTDLQPSGLAAPPPGDVEHPLPINLATALRLSDARPLVIAAAQASLQLALAQWNQAKVLWLPDVYLGASYDRHDGGAAGNAGNLFINGRNQLLAGAGLTAVVSVTDAIFAPLAARQVVKARQIDVQTARNDALLAVAEAYFNVQEARGRLSGARDGVTRGAELARVVRALSKDLAPAIEVHRVLAELAEVREAEALARQVWEEASSDLARELRLNPAAVLAPLEPPAIQLTLFSPRLAVDDLIPIGLTNRPELAAQQALVQATLIRIRQEKLRPLIPSIVLTGDNGRTAPGGYLWGGVYASDTNQHDNPLAGRNDFSVEVLWELRNLGFGNHAAVQVQEAERQRAVIELFRIQDRVAAEVARAHAQVVGAAARVNAAEVGLEEAQATYTGNLKGLSQTTRFGDILTLITRPQEAVAALRMLLRAYDEYFIAVNDYNRAQFRLYRALGYPACILTCERPTGEIVPIDTSRPPPLPPVCAPPPCRGCRFDYGTITHELGPSP
jgi:outer membrane protein TolC